MTPPPISKDRPALRLEMVVAIGAACFWALDLGLLRAGTPAALDDSWEYALAAQSLLSGHGFRTTMIHPPLWGLRDAALTVPLLVHGPLLPLLLAPLLRVLGPAVMDAVAWLAAAFAVAAAVGTARVAARAGGRGAGILAALLVTASPITLRMVHHDIAPAAGACVTAWGLDLVTRASPRPFLAGLLLGLGALVRPEFLLALPLAAVALGAAALPALLGGYVLAALPWAAHTMAATGSPTTNLSSLLLLAYTRSHPSLSPLGDFGLPPPQWGAAIAQALPELPAKWAHLAPRAVRHLLVCPSVSLGWLAAAGAWAALRRQDSRRRAVLALLVAGIPLVLVTTTESSERYVAVFLPLWALGVVLGLEALRASVAPRLSPLGARVAGGAVLFAATLPAIAAEATQAHALRDWIARERVGLVERAAPARAHRLMFSDAPDFTAWQTGRPTVYVGVEDYARLPAPGDSAADRPSRGGPEDEWFHADLRAIPAPTPGGPAGLTLEAHGATGAR